MTISNKHKFVSGKSDSADSSLVQPSNWNDDHEITLAAGKVLGRDTSGAGAVQELPVAVDSSGNVGIGTSSPTQKLDVGGNVNVGGGAVDIRPANGSTDTCSLEIGDGRTGNGYSHIDLVGDATYTDFGARIIRTNTGPNASTLMYHRGTGDLYFIAVEAAPIAFSTSSVERMRITSAGKIGIGTSSPLASLAISGGGILGTQDGDYFSGGAYFDSTWKNSVSSQGGWAIRNTSGVFTVYTGVSPGTAGSTLSDFSEKFRIDGSGNLSFNSGYGSAGVAYGCRAWVNFNGTGTVAIKASGNVSSITDNGAGDYTLNFATSMPDANYSTVFGVRATVASVYAEIAIDTGTAPTTSAVRIWTMNGAGTRVDNVVDCNVVILR